jgi:hypothetical protein
LINDELLILPLSDSEILLLNIRDISDNFDGLSILQIGGIVLSGEGFVS